MGGGGGGSRSIGDIQSLVDKAKQELREAEQAGKKNVEITHIEPAGNYAIQLTFSDGHATGIYSWDLLYDYGLRQEEMWQRYLKSLAEAGASREPGPAPFEQRPKSK
mgnify:CR=1 FL=1